MKMLNRRQTAKLISILQQLFIVGTLGSLFVFVPLHSENGTSSLAMEHSLGKADEPSDLLRQTTGATDSLKGVDVVVTPTPVFQIARRDQTRRAANPR